MSSSSRSNGVVDIALETSDMLFDVAFFDVMVIADLLFGLQLFVEVIVEEVILLLRLIDDDVAVVVVGVIIARSLHLEGTTCALAFGLVFDLICVLCVPCLFACLP